MSEQIQMIQVVVSAVSKDTDCNFYFIDARGRVHPLARIFAMLEESGGTSEMLGLSIGSYTDIIRAKALFRFSFNSDSPLAEMFVVKIEGKDRAIEKMDQKTD